VGTPFVEITVAQLVFAGRLTVGRAARASTSRSGHGLTFAAIGAVALGGSIYFGLSAKSQYDDLKAECAPRCAQSRIDSVRSKAVVSDVALATSLVALGAAAYFYFSAKPGDHAVTALGIEPLPQGANARLRFWF